MMVVDVGGMVSKSESVMRSLLKVDWVRWVECQAM